MNTNSLGVVVDGPLLSNIIRWFLHTLYIVCNPVLVRDEYIYNWKTADVILSNNEPINQQFYTHFPLPNPSDLHSSVISGYSYLVLHTVMYGYPSLQLHTPLFLHTQAHRLNCAIAGYTRLVLHIAISGYPCIQFILRYFFVSTPTLYAVLFLIIQYRTYLVNTKFLY
jgi:hypothetical protein